MTTPPFDPASERDIAIVSAQLGRPARNVIGIAARCVCGAPTVVSTAPRLADGTRSPTLYYLSHPAATAAMSFLEATPGDERVHRLLAADEELAPHTAARTRPTWRTAPASSSSPEIENFSAGGMPVRVKCLHALAGHALAAGPGVNPIGDLALERSTWSPAVCECIAYEGIDAAEPGTDA